MKITLLSFPGCPGVDAARAALTEAVRRASVSARIEAIDTTAPTTPDSLRNWPSPTVLIDGVDLEGRPGPDGIGCRLYGGNVGSPSVELIERRLRERVRTRRLRWIAAATALALVVAAGAAIASVASEPAGSVAAIPRLDRDRARQIFNAGVGGRRVIVFFSSGCASCDTGSAALQTLLAQVDRPLTLLAVWEPVFERDPVPAVAMLDNLTDARVHQLWDPDHVMSAEMRATELAHPTSPPQARARMGNDPDGLIYDVVAVFPPGVRWDDTLPAPSYLGIGLEAHLTELREQLEPAP